MDFILVASLVNVFSGGSDTLYLAEAASSFIESAFRGSSVPEKVTIVFKDMSFSSSWLTGLVDLGYTEVAVCFDVKADFFVVSFSESLSVKKRFWRNFSSRGEFFVSDSFDELMSCVVEEISRVLNDVWWNYLKRHGDNVLVERISRESGTVLAELRSFEPEIEEGQAYFFYPVGDGLESWRFFRMYVREVDGNVIFCELLEGDVENVSSVLGARGYIVSGGA